ncbi:hypothetical protein CGRA01v4_01483 [Colletotrichum graminicola]|uniref:Uncharacterized protein n=1 Tax=Colletotrichum graminicola (strain M1.001 / M2 / FGSC 10212) TaxID=645133 RepID=E3QL27_COLGM|nr:uncharacterized protein GLRG_06854 [Colletotrichum graminicola M1.001]EFQ31565.1 hypothetical protein GLRG_06854 [Colletotrichum graminicola M1.001]WDK10204.1 hypothetical protein CGRA01v4_01483 [Colletotrichum graminicola]
MECPNDELELAKRRLGFQIQILRDEMERQFKRILTQTVEAHENDRKNNFERYLTRASLECPPGIFERLKSWIRGEFPSYISAFHYSQGGSYSINFTNTPPPGAWEPIVVDMNKIFDQIAPTATDAQKDMAALKGVHPSENTPTTPSRRPLPTNRRTSPRIKTPCPKKTDKLPTARVEKSKPSNRSLPQTPRKQKRPVGEGSQPVGGGVIKTAVATKTISENPSWAFSYDLGEGFQYYILRCPTPGCQFSFSLNPLKNNMAVSHFEECKVPYLDETDIVRRYARQLQKQRMDKDPSGEVSKMWIDNYNQQVARERKRRRRKEPKSAFESPKIHVVDGSSTESPETSPGDTEIMQM